MLGFGPNSVPRTISREQHGPCSREESPFVIPKSQRGKPRLRAGKRPFRGSRSWHAAEMGFQTGPWEQRGFCFYPPGGRLLHSCWRKTLFLRDPHPWQLKRPPVSSGCRKRDWKSHRLPKGPALDVSQPTSCRVGAGRPVETLTPSLAQQRAGQRPVSLPLVNMSQAGHRCRPKSTLFNPGRNSLFSPDLYAYLCQPVLSGVGEGTQDSIKKAKESSLFHAGLRNRLPRGVNRTPSGISNSISWRWSEILHRPDVQVQAPSVERTRPGDNGMLLR